jgi:hypothetical protein
MHSSAERELASSCIRASLLPAAYELMVNPLAAMGSR